MSAASIELLPHDAALGDRLAEDLREARGLSIAVAYAKQSALEAVDLDGWTAGDRRLRLLAGTDFALTELELLRRLEPRPQVACRVYHSLGPGTFHPKLYVIDKEDRRVAYVGSSNLTLGGLRQNVEANVRIEAPFECAEAEQPLRAFEGLFDSEFSTPITADFEARYNELQARQRAVLLEHREAGAGSRFRAAGALLVSRHRAATDSRKHLLVVDPPNYALCMRGGTWGHQREHEIKSYEPGELFFFHVTQGRGIAAMGMFTGPAYFDRSPLWQDMGKGSYPWRRKFVVVGELRTGIPTRAVLEPVHPGAPKRWFNGFIQASHSLAPEDFGALHAAFESALRAEIGLDAAIG